MMKVFRRVVVAIVVVGGTAAFDARAIGAETVDHEEVWTGNVSVHVPAPPPPLPSVVLQFRFAVGCEDGEDEDCVEFTQDDVPDSGTLTLSFRNHTVGSPPEVARILCPGKRAGVRLRVTGLSAGTEVTATFSASAESETRVVSHVVTLELTSLEAAAGVRVGVCERL